MSGKIYISVINDLVTDQRVHKVATTLHESGYEVCLVGRKLPYSPKCVNRDYTTYRFHMLFHKGPLFYAEYNIRLFFFLLIKKFDILLSNDLDTLPANYLVSSLRNKKLVFDSHELFTEVPELVNRKIVKKIWEIIEKTFLPKLDYAYTVNESLAEIYHKKYHTKFEVIRNVPVCKKKEVSRPSDRLIDEFFQRSQHTIIYQGALNIGRGIDLMIEAMQYVLHTSFVIVGDGDCSKQLKQLVYKYNLGERVFFPGRILPELLLFYTKKASLGISIEENMGLNYYYALPNKLFDYIHAQIPVLVSPFPEMKKIVDTYEIGTFIRDRNPKTLAKQVNDILNDNNLRGQWKKNLLTASQELCWEKEEYKIIDIFRNNLKSGD